MLGDVSGGSRRRTRSSEAAIGYHRTTFELSVADLLSFPRFHADRDVGKENNSVITLQTKKAARTIETETAAHQDHHPIEHPHSRHSLYAAVSAPTNAPEITVDQNYDIWNTAAATAGPPTSSFIGPGTTYSGPAGYAAPIPQERYSEAPVASTNSMAAPSANQVDGVWSSVDWEATWEATRFMMQTSFPLQPYSQQQLLQDQQQHHQLPPSSSNPLLSKFMEYIPWATANPSFQASSSTEYENGSMKLTLGGVTRDRKKTKNFKWKSFNGDIEFSKQWAQQQAADRAAQVWVEVARGSNNNQRTQHHHHQDMIGYAAKNELVQEGGKRQPLKQVARQMSLTSSEGSGKTMKQIPSAFQKFGTIRGPTSRQPSQTPNATPPLDFLKPSPMGATYALGAGMGMGVGLATPAAAGARIGMGLTTNFPPPPPRIPTTSNYPARLLDTTTMAVSLAKRKREESDNEDDYESDSSGTTLTKRRPTRGAGGGAISSFATIGTSKGSTPRKPKHAVPIRIHPDAAAAPEILVPIRIDMDVDGYRLKDTFTWNLNEKVLTPEMFAEIMCEDLQVPAATYAATISNAIKTQLREFSGFFAAHDVPAEADSRVLIKLDIVAGKLHLQDRFEWDLSSREGVTPEDFARIITAEMGIGGEFVTVIAHSIHEQIYRNRFDVSQGRHPRLSVVDEDSVERGGERGGGGGLRRGLRVSEEKADMFCPSLSKLSPEAVARMAQEQERSMRYVLGVFESLF
ncbi:SWI SNF, matrix associated, actin dependent regulator of chromatin, sub b, member 1 [Quaeritorhiza haematococci]|nr:SWI SNF, matrix associated, actin dependent regulator of chromatin, sub b, member 1 [Quaeritorhiza haematococci]